MPRAGAREKSCSYTRRLRGANDGHCFSFLSRLPTQAYPSQTAPNTNSGFLSPKCPARGLRFHLGTAVGMGALPAAGLISATLLRLPSCQEQPSLTVCTTTASAWVTVMCLPAGRTTQDWKEPVCGWGSRRGSGWEERLAIAQCESRCLDSPSRYVGQVPSTLKLPSWAPITSLYLDWKGMASQDPSPGSHGRLGLQFPAELGLPDPWQCTLCRALAPIPHSQKSP